MAGAADCFMGYLGNHRFRGDQQSCNRGCVLQGGADHLGRVDDALCYEVLVLAGLWAAAVGIVIPR